MATDAEERMAGGEKSTKWETTRNFLAVVGIISPLAAMFAVYRAVYPPSPIFSVQAESGPVAIPKLFWDDVTAKAPGVDFSEFKNLNRHISLSITNTGDRVAKNLEIQIGESGSYATSDYPGRNPFKDRVRLGDLPVLASVKVEVWDSGDARASHNQSITLCHDEGAQNVDLSNDSASLRRSIGWASGLLGVLVSLCFAGFAFLITRRLNKLTDEAGKPLTARGTFPGEFTKLPRP